MKEKITDEIKEIISQSVSWARLEVEYAKLTIAEKITVLASMFVIGAICLLLGIVVLILLAFALVEVFKSFMAPGLAFLSVAGIICILIVLLYLCRRPILLNPIAKALTKVFLNSHHSNEKSDN